MTQTELEAKLKNFIAEWQGKLLDFDGMYGGQCFDLIQAWNYDLGGSWIYGEYAYEIFDQPTPLYNKVENTLTAEVEPGDIIVWKKEYNGWAGHTAIAVRRININAFEAFSQNDPAGSKCGLKIYDYSHIRGFLRPITVSTNTMDRRGYWFDLMNKVIWNKPHEQLTDDDIKGWVTNYKTERERAGKWDLIVNKAFNGPTDSNPVSVETLIMALSGNLAEKCKLLADQLAKCQDLYNSAKAKYYKQLEDIRNLVNKFINEA